MENSIILTVPIKGLNHKYAKKLANNISQNYKIYVLNTTQQKNNFESTSKCPTYT